MARRNGNQVKNDDATKAGSASGASATEAGGQPRVTDPDALLDDSGNQAGDQGGDGTADAVAGTIGTGTTGTGDEKADPDADQDAGDDGDDGEGDASATQPPTQETIPAANTGPAAKTGPAGDADKPKAADPAPDALNLATKDVALMDEGELAQEIARLEKLGDCGHGKCLDALREFVGEREQVVRRLDTHENDLRNKLGAASKARQNAAGRINAAQAALRRIRGSQVG